MNRIGIVYLILALATLGCSKSGQGRMVVKSIHEDKVAVDSAPSNYQMETQPKIRIDTVMYAQGHSFGYHGDISDWDGWYFDTVRVGEERMLRYDSVGSSSIKLSLITRDLTVDMGDTQAPEEIKEFVGPIDGFKRFQKEYETCIDSINDEEDGELKCMALVSFSMDYANPGCESESKINQFISRLAQMSDNEEVNVSSSTAAYIGHKPSKSSNKRYKGNPNDMNALSKFVNNTTIEDWRKEENLPYLGSCARTVEIRAHILNPQFVTFSKYDYNRVGTGHGMYTENFYSFDMNSGKELSNRDIFKPNTSEKVKQILLETMSEDPYYRTRNPGIKTSADVESQMEEFVLPEGALTDSGVVFSFQPYEIDIWAAGAFHFIVPYSELMPYLTSKAKKLIRGCNF